MSIEKIAYSVRWAAFLIMKSHQIIFPAGCVGMVEKVKIMLAQIIGGSQYLIRNWRDTFGTNFIIYKPDGWRKGEENTGNYKNYCESGFF